MDTVWKKNTKKPSVSTGNWAKEISNSVNNKPWFFQGFFLFGNNYLYMAASFTWSTKPPIYFALYTSSPSYVIFSSPEKLSTSPREVFE